MRRNEELLDKDGTEAAFAGQGASVRYPADIALEPVHLEIDLQVDLRARTIAGTVTTVVEAQVDGADTITIDGVGLEEVRLWDPEGQPVAWQYDGDVVIVRWQDPFRRGERRCFSTAYRVTDPVAGLYFSDPDAELSPYVISENEPELARYWLPCLDEPHVRTTLDVRLRATSGLKVLATGYLVAEEEHNDGTRTAHWRLDQRCPSYLIAIAIGDFIQAIDASFDDGEKMIPLASFASREFEELHLRKTFGRTRQMMAWLVEKLGQPLPVPKYYQVALPGLAGAMENLSLVGWDDRFILDETLAPELGWLVDRINVHEMAHCYLGNAVVTRDFSHVWLKEGWATFMGQVWAEETRSQDEALYIYYLNTRLYFEEADTKYQRPLVTRRYRAADQMFDRHSYQGGAGRLHTLRNELGDEVFWSATRDYVSQYAGRVVETDDLRRVMEVHSGRSLGRFFDQWFATAGYPDLAVTFEYDESVGRGTFVIEQQQVNRDVPPFAFATEVSWTIDGEETHRPVTIDSARHVVTVDLLRMPEIVRFDPKCRFLHKLSFNPGCTMLRRQLTESPDIIGRIQAADELSRTGRRANIEAIADAFREEPFWGVRIEFARVLAETQSDVGIAGLARAVAIESSPLALPEVIRSAGLVRDRRIRDAVINRLADGLLPLATAAAYEALGAQRMDAPWDVLIAGSQCIGPGGYAQAGAMRGIGATRRPEARSLLLAAVVRGSHSNRVRPAAAEALGGLGAVLGREEREEVWEKLVDLLRDPWPAVRWSAAGALVKMGAVDAIPALEALARPMPPQERIRVERMIERLRQVSSADRAGSVERLDALEARARFLQNRLDALEARIEAEIHAEEILT